MDRVTEQGSFSSVDQACDPQFFVTYLDKANAAESFQAYKQETFALLKLKRGNSVLDVGCGKGEDIVSLARIVGSAGHAIGVDTSVTMIKSAQERAHKSALPVEYRVANACQLPFSDGVFDGCRADRLFQHLQEPLPALKEMVRVVRLNGRVVVSEPDWETLVIDSLDRNVTRVVRNYFCDRATINGWIGRRLPYLFQEAGLKGIAVIPRTLIITKFDFADLVFQITNTVRHVEEAGLLSVEDGGRWLEILRTADRANHFFSSATGFNVSGIKA